MADIKQIQVGGTTYNLKDEAAREALATKQDAITAVVSPNVTEDGGDPSASVEFENGQMSFAFSNLKGDTGATGPQGPQGDSVLVGQGDLPLAHVLGQDNTKAMSQKGVTDAVDGVMQSYPLSNTGETVGEGFHIADPNLNIGMKYSASGFDVAKLSQHFMQLIRWIDAPFNLFAEVVEDGFFVADKNLNVIAKIDDGGIHSVNILDFETVNY